MQESSRQDKVKYRLAQEYLLRWARGLRALPPLAGLGVGTGWGWGGGAGPSPSVPGGGEMLNHGRPVYPEDSRALWFQRDGRFQAGEQWGQGAPHPGLNPLCSWGGRGRETGPESIFASSSSWGLVSSNFPSSSLYLIHSFTHSCLHSLNTFIECLPISRTEDEAEIGRHVPSSGR